jgi:hypothetical protein
MNEVQKAIWQFHPHSFPGEDQSQTNSTPMTACSLMVQSGVHRSLAGAVAAPSAQPPTRESSEAWTQFHPTLSSLRNSNFTECLRFSLTLRRNCQAGAMFLQSN